MWESAGRFHKLALSHRSRSAAENQVSGFRVFLVTVKTSRIHPRPPRGWIMDDTENEACEPCDLSQFSIAGLEEIDSARVQRYPHAR